MTTYYVRPASEGGNNSNSGTSTGAAWATIQSAVARALSPGDIIKVMPGTYAENVTISPGAGSVEGEEGSVITLESYDAANPAAITQNYDEFGAIIGTNRLRIIDRSHWKVYGIKFANYNTGGVYVYAGTQNVIGVTIEECIFDNQRDKSGSMSHVISFGGIEPYACSYFKALRNHIGDVTTGVTNASYNECVTIYRSAHHGLVQGNTVGSSSYLTFDVISKNDQYGKGLVHHIIFDGNTVLAAKSDAWGNNNGFKIDGGDYILFQNNKGYNIDFNASGSEPWSNTYKQTEADPYKYHIWRNNVWDTRDYPTAANNGAFLGSDRFTYRDGSGRMITGSYGWLRNLYFVHNFLAARRSEYYVLLLCVAWNVRIKNNVLWHAGGGQGLSKRYYSAWVDWSHDFRTAGWQWAGNLWYTSGSPYWETPDGKNYDTFAKWSASVEPTAEWGEPTFGSDYMLTSGSPGYGDGVALTYAVGAGSSSTTLYVQDAGYFCDGWDMITPDAIFVGGTEVDIDSVDYDNNKIALATAISWSDGAEVGYASNPSIGILSEAGSDGEQDVDAVTASAGPDQTIYVPSGDTATVTLDGRASRATAGIAAYAWTPASWGIAATATATVTLPLGTHELTLTVTDSQGNTDTDAVIIVVTDEIPAQPALVRNPCLNGAGSWLLFSTGNTTWTPLSGGGYEVEVTADGGNTQLSQAGISVTQGERLTLRLVATADTSPQALDVRLFKDTSPWTNYGLSYAASVGTTETVIEYEFTVNATANDARLMIFFATGQHVSIQEFNLLRAGESGCYDENYTPITESGDMTVSSTADVFGDAGGQWGANQSPSFAGDWRTDYGNYDYFTIWTFAADVAIPDGAEITEATLTVTSAGYQGALPKLRVDVENSGNATAPVSNADAAGRAWLIGTAWQAVAWATSTQYAVSISAAMIQQWVAAQAGIDNGAGINLRLIDADNGFQANRLAYLGTAAAELYIAWDVPSDGGTYAEESTTLKMGMNHGYRIGL